MSSAAAPSIILIELGVEKSTDESAPVVYGCGAD